MSYCNPILFSSKTNSDGEQENRLFYRAVFCTLTAISMVAPPLTPHLFLTNNYLDIPPNFGQALTIAIRYCPKCSHDRDCYTSSLSTVASSYITLRSNIGPKELIKLISYPFKTLQCTLRLHTAQNALCMLTHVFCINRKGGTGGSGLRCCTHGSS